MNCKTRYWTTMCISVMFVSNALADEMPEKQLPPSSNWSIGAGIGFGNSYQPVAYYSRLAGGSGGTLGGLSGTGVLFQASSFDTSSPSGNILLERLLNPSWALLFRLSGHYFHNDDKINNDVKSASGLGAFAGARWIINPGQVVMVSPYSVFVARWGLAKGDFQFATEDGWAKNDYSSYTYSIGLVFGLALETKLMDNLFLRLESTVCQASYNWSESTVTDSDQVEHHIGYEDFGASLAFQPSLQLRLAF